MSCDCDGGPCPTCGPFRLMEDDGRREQSLPDRVAELERWKADATTAINDAMADMEWDCIPASECGETWAYVAEFQRLVGHPLAAKETTP